MKIRQTRNFKPPDVNEFEWHSSPQLLDVRYLSEDEILRKELKSSRTSKQDTNNNNNNDSKSNNNSVSHSLDNVVVHINNSKNKILNDNSSVDSSIYTIRGEIDEMFKSISCEQQTEIKRLALSNKLMNDTNKLILNCDDHEDKLSTESDTTYNINHEKIYSYDITKSISDPYHDEETVTTSCDSSSVSISPQMAAATMAKTKLNEEQPSPGTSNSTLVINNFVSDKENQLDRAYRTASISTCPVCGPETQTISSKHCLFCCRKISTSPVNATSSSSVSTSPARKTKSKSSPKSNKSMKPKTDSNGYVNRIISRASFKRKHSHHKHPHHHHHHHRELSRTEIDTQQQLQHQHQPQHLPNPHNHHDTTTKLDGSYTHESSEYLRYGVETNSSLLSCSECCYFSRCHCYPSMIANCTKCNTRSIGKHNKNILLGNGHNNNNNNNHYATDGSNGSSLPYWSITKHLTEKRSLKKKNENRERYLLMFVTAFAIIVFLSVSYFGVLLFLRLTRAPID